MTILYKCNNIVTENEVKKGAILVSEGKIAKIYFEEDLANVNHEVEDIIDFGNLTLMTGIVDSHVHVNEPGRTEWEGFETATKAAASGGITTIVDMPLNSIPPTTTMENLLTKIAVAKDKAFVDVAFWGGLIPNNHQHLISLVTAGVVGFKCFLCDSGVEEFPGVSLKDVELALDELTSSTTVLAFHAEMDGCSSVCAGSNPRTYETFLNSRPDSMEIEAIESILKLAEKFNNRIHIVHLSSSKALNLIRDFKRKHPGRLTVETCHHYLSLAAESIPESNTQFKCCPPLRSRENLENLWEALKTGDIDMVVSDHSPSTPNLKKLDPQDDDYGDFIKAWGGISSLQFGLSLFWTGARQRNLALTDVTRLLSQNPAKLCGLNETKGFIREGYDADFVVWEPKESFILDKSHIHHRHKVTPYLGHELHGVVHYTILRGNIIYQNGKLEENPQGNLLIG